jgi:thiamine-phosphate pyrophosphorylase
VSATHPAPLLVITDRQSSARPLEETVTAAFAGGCRWVMVREKDLDTMALIPLAARIVLAAQRAGARVLVNGDVDAALAVDASGVHLPQGSSVAEARQKLTGLRIIGVSAHSLAEAREAEDAGADYVTLSPIFETASKPGYGPALGTDALAQVTAEVSIPVLALGGISASNAASCLKAGASGVAVMGAVMGAPAPDDAVREILAALEG